MPIKIAAHKLCPSNLSQSNFAKKELKKEEEEKKKYQGFNSDGDHITHFLDPQKAMFCISVFALRMKLNCTEFVDVSL